jgi:CubicO group peptidase (beta-lactamase class C family)
MLAEMLIARLSGKAYSEYVRDKIFTPLKADSSGFSDKNYTPGSYAVKGTLPHEYLNIMASGGTLRIRMGAWSNLTILSICRVIPVRHGFPLLVNAALRFGTNTAAERKSRGASATGCGLRKP